MPDIVTKRTNRNARENPDIAPDSTHPISVRVDAEIIEREGKRALVVQDVPKGSEWTILSDEGPGIGGDDTAPEPLSYVAAGVAFCLLTQLSQYRKANRLAISSLRLEQTTTYSLEGSWRAATRRGRCLGLETVVHVESDEPTEVIEKMISTAEQACFAEQALALPVPLATRAVQNGVELAIAEAPAGSAAATAVRERRS